MAKGSSIDCRADAGAPQRRLDCSTADPTPAPAAPEQPRPAAIDQASLARYGLANGAHDRNQPPFQVPPFDGPSSKHGSLTQRRTVIRAMFGSPSKSACSKIALNQNHAIWE